jgi:ParB/RepB/Spo0J family partition protein
MLFDPHKIQLKRSTRQRTEIDTDEILESIQKHGQLQPIIVTHDENCQEHSLKSYANICCCEEPILIAGERRLESCKKLGINIEVKFLDQLSPIELQEIEFEENRKRKPLPWRDEAKAITKIHNMYLAENPSWTVKQTAEKIFISQPTIAAALLIVQNFDSELLTYANSISQAGELLRRFHQEKTQNITKSLFEEKPFNPNQSLPAPKNPKLNNLQLDFPTQEEIIAEENKIKIINTGLKTYAYLNPTARFDIIHLDLSDKSPEISQEILNYFKLIRDAQALLIWMNSKYLSWLIQQMIPDFRVLEPPVIWYKTDTQETYNSYEPGLIFYKPQTNLNIKKNLYANPDSKYKPKSVLTYFLSFIINENLSFFDPFAKNGNSLLAAKSLNAKSIFGLEINEILCQEANEKLLKEKI